MATEIGKAYVQIIPSSQGISGSISKILDGEAESAGKSAGTKISSALGGALKVAAGATAAAVSAATAAVGSLAKAAVSSYANYEQLTGGVDKLFGAASVRVKQYAEEAYKTSGMSANAYMETATSFSASLIDSLGGNTYKAAEMVEVAMKAMSDNVNVFGSDFQSVQNAFQGFAKQNYTMLDNLKLGYGGTKQEMERLIADANEYAESIGQVGDMSIESFADVVRAIELIQEKQHIAGTTAKEAMTTIEGSAAATKAAWENVVTAIGRGEGISDAIKGLTDSIFGQKSGEGLLNQIIPRIEIVMQGIGKFIEQASPFITEKIPALINSVLPSILESAATLIEALASGLIAALPQITKTAGDIIMQLVDSIVQLLPQILEVGLQIIIELANGIAKALPTLIPKIVDVVVQMAQTLIDNVGPILDAAMALIMGLSDGIFAALPQLLQKMPELVTQLTQALVENAPLLISVGAQIMWALIDGLAQSLPHLIFMDPQLIAAIIEGIIQGLPQMVESGKQVLYGLIEGIVMVIPNLIEAGKQAVDNLLNTFKNLFGIHSPSTVMAEMGKNLIQGLINGIKELLSSLKDSVTQIGTSIKNTLKSFIDGAKNWGKDLLQNFINGIMSKFDSLRSTLESAADLVKSILGFSEPEIGPLSNFHTFAPDMMALFAKGIQDNTKLVTDQLKKSFDFSDAVMQYAVPEGGFAVADVGQDRAETTPAEATNGEPIILNAYFGQERIDTIIFEAIERGKYRMGGRV